MPPIGIRICLFALAVICSQAAHAETAPQPQTEDRFVCRFEHSISEATSCGLESTFRDAALPKHGMAMYEVNGYHGVEPTPEQRKAASDLLQRSFDSAKAHGWFDFDKASADGYERLLWDPIHYVNEEYIFDDHILDPERPEYLMYYHTSQGKKLVAFMFVTRKPLDTGPQIGGSLTQWHYHRWSNFRCLLEGVLTVSFAKAGKCEVGVSTKRSPEMLHVWLLDTPFGRFGHQMDLPIELIEKLVKQRGGD